MAWRERKCSSVSIHALAKRATSDRNILAFCEHVSIHALAKRATYNKVTVAIFHTKFQSTPSRRGRPPRSEPIGQQPASFNPRPREEGDRVPGKKECSIKSFNPRPREEGDLEVIHVSLHASCFNPRPREEGDGRI